jgi:nucleoside-diphosphate-sugar epimerase
MRVVVTGGTGTVGELLRARITSRFDCRFLSHEDADVTDLAALERVFAGADAVVHLAANASVAATFEDLVGPNLVGAYNTFEAARRSGVRRVVFASSNHVMGMYQWDAHRFADPARPEAVVANDPVRPDSLYGATKAWGEALGRMYAERHGLSVVCLRIGWVTADDRRPPARGMRHEPPDVAVRGQQMWLSHRDCASLVEAALTADVAFAIVHGVSDNVGRWFSLEEAALIGWTPVDGLELVDPNLQT